MWQLMLERVGTSIELCKSAIEKKMRPALNGKKCPNDRKMGCLERILGGFKKLEMTGELAFWSGARCTRVRKKTMRRSRRRMLGRSSAPSSRRRGSCASSWTPSTSSSSTRCKRSWTNQRTSKSAWNRSTIRGGPRRLTRQRRCTRSTSARSTSAGR